MIRVSSCSQDTVTRGDRLGGSEIRLDCDAILVNFNSVNGSSGQKRSSVAGCKLVQGPNDFRNVNTAIVGSKDSLKFRGQVLEWILLHDLLCRQQPVVHF